VVDGVPVSSASNTIAGVIPGVTINLISASSDTPVQITVGADSTQIADAIKNFAAAYNTVVQGINTQFAVDSTTNTQGPLGSDSSLRSLQSSLLNDVTYSISGNGGLVNLASLGIDLNNDGTLTVNQTATADHPALGNLLATNPAAVQSFFQNLLGTGFANHFSADLNNLIDATQGVLTSDISQNSAQQRNLTNSIHNFQDQLAAEQASLTKVFAQVNASLQAYPLLLQQVTETLGSLPGSIVSASGASGSSHPTLTSGL
jgi:flagellar hook-associated protein 2